MLHSMKNLIGWNLHATDGDIGTITDVYFDDHDWEVRYLVVEAGNWLDRHSVLISPDSARWADDEDDKLSVSLTRDQVKNSPDIDTARPLSRQNEIAYRAYYGWPYYWSGVGMLEDGTIVEPGVQTQTVARDEGDDPHLRSAKEVISYSAWSGDVEVGVVEDMLLDTAGWVVRYLAVDSGQTFGGKHLVIAPAWIESMSWHENRVHLELTPEEIRHSPEWDPGSVTTREYEESLHDYLDRPRYWP
jgi:hypothetical protein